MLVIKRVKDLESHAKRLRNQGGRNVKIPAMVGFVPTMGALHPGHINLLKTASQECDITVCSIFINPTQFNDKSDFEKYPVTLDKDIEMLHDAGCDILFLPSVKEIYPNGLKNKQPVNFGFLAQTLEGEHRPGHFNGMAQVVERLLRIVQPDRLYMGQKDYQQQLIVGELIKNRKFKTKLVVCPTVREKDGLAMSSRNTRLNPESRKTAAEISKALKEAKVKVTKGPSVKEKDVSYADWIEIVEQKGYGRLAVLPDTEPEYFEIRNARTLGPPRTNREKLVALAAVKVGGVRLIDNMVLNN